MTGRLVFVKRITRDMLRAEPEARFVFGDNVARAGYGGQAREMRGEPNAIGVATKWRPGVRSFDFFEDDGDPEMEYSVDEDLARVTNELESGRTVYFPSDGIGTGLSELPTRAPELHKYIVDYVADLARRSPA